MNRTIKRFPSFILGTCRCGCNEDIPIKSKDCKLQKFKYKHNMRGMNHHSFRDGRSNTTGGYVIIKMPWHPNAMKDGYITEHIWMMSRKLGRPLKKGEVVHHINGNKDDNRIENLELIENNVKHLVEKHLRKDKSGRFCYRCKSSHTYYNEKKGHYKWYVRDEGFLCNICYGKEHNHAYYVKRLKKLSQNGSENGKPMLKRLRPHSTTPAIIM